ncbi:class III lanthionine synthetase LanKC N-terminal domain-containing protein [Flavitalea flava]
MDKVLQLNNYSEILKTYGLEGSPSGYYWQVGEIKQTQGWIIHLSVIKLQVANLLQVLIPKLLEWQVPFKIARDLNTVSNLLDGGLGFINLGKIVCVYPTIDQDTNFIAKKLILLTNDYKGPIIHTDRHLGSIVYTRFGSFTPIMVTNENGDPVQYIYNNQGQLVPDPYTIPFEMPKGISWPFSDITIPIPPIRRKLLNFSYYPLITIKPDAKGNVIKGIYFKKLWQIHTCLIKQGRQQMFVDSSGRDIRDRLRWQNELYQMLNKYVPMPEVFDFFQEYEDSYLAMAFIKGVSLQNWIASYYKGRSWIDLNNSSKIALIDRLLETLDIIRRIHEKGYLHRDITSHNFIVDLNEKIWLIDMELAWSINRSYPDPPFSLGTPGYMSPEQNSGNTKPSIKEDIYGLGALAQEFFTNLPPIKLEQNHQENLQNAILFFTKDEEIARLIITCKSVNPQERPSLTEFQEIVTQFRSRVSSTIEPLEKPINSSHFSSSAVNTIQEGLQGLIHPDLILPQIGWLSMKQREEDNIGNPQIEQDIYEGWHTGISGPLWLVARAKKCGFNIENCVEIYNQSWVFLNQNYFTNSNPSNSGLYSGGAGISMALVEGIESGLLSATQNTISCIESCFFSSTTNIDLSTGVSGQGIARIRANKWINSSKEDNVLITFIDNLIKSQKPDGSWDLGLNLSNRKNTAIGLNKGIAGISWFLLAFLEKNPSHPVKKSLVKSLDWILKVGRKKSDCYIWPISTKSNDIDLWGMGNGIPGIALLFVKSYAILGDLLYKEIAEDILQHLNPHPIYTDFSLSAGLAGLGEIYLEAFTICKNTLWKNRADWIANFFLHSAKKSEDGSKYWLTKMSEFATADLFTGNSGILHFLIRHQNPNELSHPLWP